MLDDEAWITNMSRILPCATASKPVVGPTQSLFRGVPESHSLAVRRLEREVDHSPPSNAEV